MAVTELICCYTAEMARTHKKVGYSPTGKLEDVTPDMAARGVEEAFRILEGRWKMVIIFHLFARGTLRFSELERAIPDVSQKMLIQLFSSGMSCCAQLYHQASTCDDRHHE